MLNRIYRTVAVSLQNLAVHRVRSYLTMLGIVWGVATVIILIAIVSGFYQDNLRRWKSFGMNMLVLDYSPSFERGGTLYPLEADVDDASFLERENPYVDEAGAEIRVYVDVQVGEISDGFGVSAVTPNMSSLMDLKPDYGRFFNEIDYLQVRKVAVVGERLRDTFFKELKAEEVLGKELFISGKVFKVIGVFKPRRTRVDWGIYVPMSAYQATFARTGGGRSSLTIYASLKNIEDYAKGKAFALRQLASKYGFDPSDENAIRVRDYAEWRESATKIYLMFFGLFYIIGILTLAVGAVGVANVMFVAVQERTREIGLRKAIGATKRTIMSQFVVEALIICVLGGLVGIALGVSIIAVMRALPLPETFPPPVVTHGSIYIAGAVNIIVGLISAYYPARRAAEMDPILALRS